MIFEVIRPNIADSQALIECQICELRYSLGEYEILSKLNKLGYFYNEDLGVVCHTCLFSIGDRILKMSGKDEYQIYVTEGDKTQSLLFTKNA